ncbi:MAG: DUF4130 domain-containing protein [Spirochaetaceae bacterium]|jgi:hypothetical protein|nr:DUF4130 domain-containing protein [Spirochaetaceae bacterium]
MEQNGFASLVSLFAALEETPGEGRPPPPLNGPPLPGGIPPRVFSRAAPPSRAAQQGDLFAPGEGAARAETVLPRSRDSGIPGPEGFGPAAAALFARSPAVWDTVILAWMSERVNENALIRFASRAVFPDGGGEAELVRGAAYKVSRELHRVKGFLRFAPDRHGIYTARCAPDYFVLPALAAHFTARFGETPWAIHDEKRRLVLARFPGAEGRLADACLMNEAEYRARIRGAGDAAGAGETGADRPAETENSAEDLWRIYHHSASNGDRLNPALQKRFMPARYRSCLPECFPAGVPVPDHPDAGDGKE